MWSDSTAQGEPVLDGKPVVAEAYRSLDQHKRSSSQTSDMIMRSLSRLSGKGKNRDALPLANDLKPEPVVVPDIRVREASVVSVVQDDRFRQNVQREKKRDKSKNRLTKVQHRGGGGHDGHPDRECVLM